MEYRLRRADGQFRWILDTGAPYHLPSGAFGGYLGSCIDITDRKLLEARLREHAVDLEQRVIDRTLEREAAVQELRRTEERYRQLIETTNEGVWVIDVGGRTTLVNPKLMRMLGYAEADVIGEPLVAFISPQDQEIAARFLDRRRTGIAEQQEVRLVTREGRELPTLMAAAPLFDAEGEYAGAVAMVSDLSERKQAEAALREREQQLRQAQRLEAVGLLAGGIAHDFNNLLTVINGFSELALGRLPEGADLRPYLTEVRNAGERAASLTRQLLAFGRRQMLQPEALDLNELIVTLHPLLRSLAGESIELMTQLGARGHVYADPSQLEQILLNLVVNARDAMPQGGQIEIHTRDVNLDEPFARTHAGARLGQFVRLEVRDTGVGMDAETQQHLFEPFFTTKPPGQGTGLGLATVYGIVKQSDGYVWVDSTPGIGTRFAIDLPPCEIPIAPSGPNEASSPCALEGETVLLAEDELGVRALTRSILEGHGYTVLEASDAVEAVQISQAYAGPIHLLLTDVIMPGVQGPELAHLVRSARPSMKLLFMTGYTDDLALRRGVAEADTAFVQKPFSPSMLLHRLREVLDADPVSTLSGGQG
jgi:two-component system, cell cycle sensor histidine kinase and response regulator CckA